MLLIIGIILLICVIVSVKLFDCYIRPNKRLKLLVIYATLLGLMLTVSGLLTMLFGG